ncbi:MAG TPA: DUF3619 family protein [Casimicrobiaceae bacterium]|nr:DUF3619 family protein [Casimicrobiaceae bacterium]
MTTNDDDFAKKITAYLDQGTAELKAGVAYRLHSARAEALARLADPERASSLALAGAQSTSASGTLGGGRSFWTSGRLWVGVALIAAAGLGFQQWQAYQQLKDLEETDAAILSSDLPIDAYLDRGFQNWLKRTSDE